MRPCPVELALGEAEPARYGKGTLQVAATGETRGARAWGMRQARRTPQYTTRLADVPVARA